MMVLFAEMESPRRNDEGLKFLWGATKVVLPPHSVSLLFPSLAVVSGGFSNETAKTNQNQANITATCCVRGTGKGKGHPGRMCQCCGHTAR